MPFEDSHKRPFEDSHKKPVQRKVYAPSSKRLKDIVERALWTAAEVGVGVLTTELADINTGVYAPLIATALAVIKGFLAKHVGRSDSASTTKES